MHVRVVSRDWLGAGRERIRVLGIDAVCIYRRERAGVVKPQREAPWCVGLVHDRHRHRVRRVGAGLERRLDLLGVLRLHERVGEAHTGSAGVAQQLDAAVGVFDPARVRPHGSHLDSHAGEHAE